MLKQVLSRSAFPRSAAALPLALQSSETHTHDRRRKARGPPSDGRVLTVGLAPADPNVDTDVDAETPFGFKNELGRVALDSGRRRLYTGGVSHKPNVWDYRTAITSAVREAQKLQASALVLESLPKDLRSMGDLFHSPYELTAEEIAEKTACFAVTAAYKYDRLKTTGKKDTNGEQSDPMGLFIVSEATEAVERGSVIGVCVNDARTLGNLREDEGTPQLYCEWVSKELVPLGVKVRDLIKGDRLQRAGLNLLYNVGKGARHEPHLVVMEYIGNRQSSETTAIVGKGVTFDCGGLNVKPFGSMETMHLDMMGAATVLSTLKAVASLKLPVNVVGVVGLAANAIGPNSYHPSTIITSRKGLTVEVLNTDAEGRLILADALTYVQKDAHVEKKVGTVIDLATLTGAILVSLGSRRAGLFSNDLSLAQRLMAGGRSSGDELWPMPVAEEHRKAMKGGIADLVNVSAGREASACTAAAFLSHFVEDGVRWAHIDIAGTGMGGDKPKGFNPAGAPGFGVQLLVDYLRQDIAVAEEAPAPAPAPEEKKTRKPRTPRRGKRRTVKK